MPEDSAMKATHTRSQEDHATEVELVRAAKRGDVDAFEQLVRRYTGVVFRVALHISRCREDAEEIAQETFLRAFRHLSSFEERARISTWLTRIAVNAALLKRRGPQPTETVTIGEQAGEDEVVPQQIADWRPNPEQLYNRLELSDMLRKALESLPNGYGTVFWLRDVEGFSIAETAEMVGITQAAVKNRLLRARLQLRELLSRYFRSRGNTTGALMNSASSELWRTAT